MPALYMRNSNIRFPRRFARHSLRSSQKKVDLIVGADGANSRVAKAMDAGEYNFAIAFQERIKISEEKMEFYEEMAEVRMGKNWSISLMELILM